MLEETYSYYSPKFSFPPRIDRAGLNNALDLVRQTGDVKGEVNLAQFIDESTIDELEREGFYKKFADRRGTK